MSYSSRFWLYAPITIFALIAVAVMAHWWIVAGAFEKRLAAIKGHEAVPGITLDWSSVTVGGFPFRLDADFTNLSVAGAGAHGPFAWTSEKFALHALTYGRPADVFEAAGRQHVGWTDAVGAGHTAQFLPGSLRASAISDSRGLGRFDLDIVDVAGQGFAIGRFQIHLRRDPDGHDLDLMLHADVVKVSGTARKLVEVYAKLNKAEIFAPLLAGKTSWPQTVAAWRAAGGAAKLSQITAPDLAPDALLSPLY